jgi:lipoprotein-anchoring transpeptidase ErfK/SrfK
MIPAKWSFFSTLILASSLAMAAGLTSEKNQALEEFEDMTTQYRLFREAIRDGLIAIPLKVQQYDNQAREVLQEQNPMDYAAAVNDPYYGYHTFILVDKSVGHKAGKIRDGSQRTPQTMYIYQREGGQLRLVETLPVSTGREPSPGVSDTREGFMRVQSAEAQYVSRKYGEAMPNSLWFESEYGTAIHQTTQARCDIAIGLRASAGCIRLCPGDSQKVFDLVTLSKHDRNSAVVLLDKRTGVPVAPRQEKSISKVKDENGQYTQAPKVVRGWPVFVRIIDGNSDAKVREIENVIQNPTDGFKKYFPGFAPEALRSKSI